MHFSVAIETYLHVLFGRLLPFLGHGAWSDRVGKHASDGENGHGSSDNAGREEEDLTALIRGRRSSWAVGTEGNVVGCEQVMS